MTTRPAVTARDPDRAVDLLVAVDGDDAGDGARRAGKGPSPSAYSTAPMRSLIVPPVGNASVRALGATTSTG